MGPSSQQIVIDGAPSLTHLVNSKINNAQRNDDINSHVSSLFKMQ